MKNTKKLVMEMAMINQYYVQFSIAFKYLIENYNELAFTIADAEHHWFRCGAC